MTMHDRISTAAAYTASGGAILFGLKVGELAALIGAAVAVATFFVNLYFKYQHLALARARISAQQADDAASDA